MNTQNIKDHKFYLVSRHGPTGSNVMFHNKDGCGYGTNLNGLHVFTKEEAQKQLDWDIKSLPLLKSEVDKLSVLHVDMQTLRGDHQADSIGEYVIQVTGKYDGNDIAFITIGRDTFDYDKAHVFEYQAALEMAAGEGNLQVWSKAILDNLARPTFQLENINTRKMITGAGLKYKKPRKQRETTGKTRSNCPKCGKITWDYNPYESAYCGEHDNKWDRI